MEPIRILTVDDFPETHELLEAHLCAEAVRIVARCSSAGRALHRANALRPDLVIADVWLPDMSGSKLVEMLKRQNPKVKIIVTSGGEYRDEAILADAFIAKGHLFKELIWTIRGFFPHRFKPVNVALPSAVEAPNV
jgi:DNA-binding NarL/FixJ family response regulator